MSVEVNVKEKYVLAGEVQIPDKIHGLSAYEIALIHGFVGTEQEWLESLRSDFEAERIKAERERVAAENARVEAEAKRQEVFDNAIGTFDAERKKAVAKFEEDITTMINEELLPEATATAAQSVEDVTRLSIESAKSEITNHTNNEKAKVKTTIETLTDKAVETVEAVVEAMDTREELVWENDSSYSFTQGDIKIDNYADYEGFRILCCHDLDSDEMHILGEQPIVRANETVKVSTTQSYYDTETNNTYAVPYGRRFSLSEDGIISVSGISSVYYRYVVPVKIYGIKRDKVTIPDELIHETLLMRDANTDIMYKLRVIDGKLTIEEVE